MKTLLIILTILSSFFANLEQKTLQTEFVASVSDEVNAPLHYPGTVTIHAQQFILSMFGIDAAYDGKSLYMYSSDTDELTISDPSQQELAQTNPFMMAKTVAENCTVTEMPSADGKETIVTLTPKEPGTGFNRFTLRIRNADLMPLHLEIREGQKTSSLQLQNPMFITSEPKFVIEPNSTTFVNDLRL
ncbi:MAG: outer membrane lipoprotein carrier protein LolA [Paludibacteraceae bacterium]|nr:outer membrane lipoprotein carrier protein LolA [Paludibacteraceae bacterium]